MHLETRKVSVCDLQANSPSPQSLALEIDVVDATFILDSYLLLSSGLHGLQWCDGIEDLATNGSTHSEKIGRRMETVRSGI